MLSLIHEDFWKKTKQKNLKKCVSRSGNIGIIIIGHDSLFGSNNKMKEFFQRVKNWWKLKLFQKRKISLAFLKSKRFWYRFFRWFLIIFGVCLVLTVGLFVWYSKDLPSPTKVVRRDGYASKIYDRNGQLLYDLYNDQKREPVASSDIPETLKKATVSVEDKEFYTHQGFDPLAPLRIIKNIFYFHKLTGGSTLTQQLVKNVLLNSDVTVTRKIKEFILAIQIEAKYSKDEILTMYLNEAPYGGISWGVGSAAEQYFNKPVKDLDLAESAILAGLPQRPNVYSPFSTTPTAYIDRTDHVLTRMVEDGYIDAETKTMTMEEVKNYKFNENATTLSAPHFVFWIKDLLAQKYGEEVANGGGLKVTTTLDLDLQNQVQKIVGDQVDKSEKLAISNGAAVVLDPRDGEVLAMVGSRGYGSTATDGQFNVVTQALRQPGSAIKPITYLMALRKGYTAATMVMDTPVSLPIAGQPDYSPKNYTGKFLGPMSLRDALGNSINTVAVKMLARVGVSNMLQQAYDMGISNLEPTVENMQKYGFAVTLGGAGVKMIDLSSAYSAFANGGTKVDAVGILKVEDSSGRVLEEFNPTIGQKVMSPQESFIISNILSDNSARTLTFGAVNSLIIPNYQVAVKTGTTNDKKDNWTIGWTPNLLVTVWVGNNNNSPMGAIASGVSGAAPIWRQIMLYALPKRDKQDFPIPDKIVNISVDKVSGYGVHDNFPSKTEYFIDGTQTNTSDPIHLMLKICKDKVGLATPEDVSNGNYNSKEYFNFKEDDPVSTDGRNRWQEGIDAWINQQTNKDIYAPPQSYCRTDGTVGVTFDQPGDHSTQNNNVDIKINTSSLKKIVKVELWVDSNSVKTWDARPFEGMINMNDGPHTLKVRATDENGASDEHQIQIGVNVNWDWSPSPTPTMTPVPTVTPISTVIPTI
ncbi:MAG: PBP1A family penicillin-binding protein, partial [Candidatus Shapirobacteria bacterium]